MLKNKVNQGAVFFIFLMSPLQEQDVRLRWMNVNHPPASIMQHVSIGTMTTYNCFRIGKITLLSKKSLK